MTAGIQSLWLVRHGETAWTQTGQHTGRTDVPLTPFGEQQASAIRAKIGVRQFSLVLASPLARARETCRLAGFADVAEIDPDLQEWDYGEFEGRTTAEIRSMRPDWSVWTHGGPGGESPGDIAHRADRVLERVAAASGDVALFAHGHLLRVLAARWLGHPPSAGAGLFMDTASVSVLASHREHRIIRHWNEICHLGGH